MPVSQNHRAPLPHVAPGLARKLGLFDATMVVMGGIVGAGIFMNPSVVARQVHTPLLILGVWVLGGLIALAGAFIYAELAARLPLVGGQYAYLREAYHPAVAFLYGWALLLVIETGGMAAVALTFARYFVELTGASLSDRTIATAALVVLTLINCLGVRAGSALQSVLMIMKIMALAALVACGWLLLGTSSATFGPVLDRPVSLDFVASLGSAMVPVLFAYGGWQTANFIAGEVREPRKNLPRGLLLGVGGVIVLYLAVNLVCARALGAQGLAATSAPASEIMRLALGKKGATFIAAGIALSTLGFLSQSILTAPRVYFAMAEDGLLFSSLAWVSPRTRVPVVAILLEGGWTIVIALWGRYEQILSYTESIDWLFFGLTATCLFVFRRREAHRVGSAGGTTGQPVRGAEHRVAYRVPGHPVTTLLFVGVSWLFVVNTLFKYPRHAAPALALVLTGVPVYFLWRWRHSRRMNTG
ncbi:MAG TPA: amino acid permease [Candidatus Acidoferrales bacterium]|nr:amino acid permease [Candidatus Acidoferrales bacterium]